MAAFGDASWNLALEANQGPLGGSLAGFGLVLARQVHGRELCWVESAEITPGWPTCDALATCLDGIGLVIRTADCAPVLLADPAARLIAAVHAGWRGLLAGVVPAAVAALRARGAEAISASIGPAICAKCYEVGPDLAKRAESEGHLVIGGADGRFWLDLPGSIARQLELADVRLVRAGLGCTAESDRLFSWRARQETGRQGGLIGLI
ncbi:MAG: polyphenol oxidase family protein [Bifidobacteriaceae bacterium]|nr:polyphenol oxidase family protein [Bifidobacteriaceae bacterium]